MKEYAMERKNFVECQERIWKSKEERVYYVKKEAYETLRKKPMECYDRGLLNVNSMRKNTEHKTEGKFKKEF